ncbi:MAG: hypothetical protein IME96_05525 [Proteobacteria bacterium]|nr:hypothetical protein [Pseudomonadota bacterium]
MTRAINMSLSLFLLLFFSPHLLNAANSNVVKLGVSAIILPHLSVTSTHQTKSLQISQQDIERGYIEVRSATVFEVRSNIKRAYYLSLTRTGDFYEKVWVMDGNRKFILNDNIVQIYQTSAGFIRGEIKTLNYRFYLSPFTTPGSYSWPIRAEVLT